MFAPPDSMLFPGMEHDAESPDQALSCPQCGSPNIQNKNYGKRIGGAVGTCAGAMHALSGTTQGAYLGAAAAIYVSESENPLNCITSAVLGALVGGAVGCATGAALGKLIDQTLLNNHCCLRCGFCFQSP